MTHSALLKAVQAVDAIHTATHAATRSPIPDNPGACRYTPAALPHFCRPLLRIAEQQRDRAYREYADHLLGVSP